MLIEENKALAPFTTFGIGGRARWFVKAAIEADVADAMVWAEERELPVFTLGGGSNLLVSDDGFPGLVVQIALKGLEFEDGLLRAGAGEDWDACVDAATRAGLAGIECLAGIPGTVGGTPVQNVGAYGQEVAGSIERVRAFDVKARTYVELENQDCRFAYRRSRFNAEDRGKYIVSRVDYRLKPGGSPTLRYVDLQRAFSAGSEPTLVEVAAAVRRIRQGKGMLMVEGDPDCRSAGSFFKNPVVDVSELARMAAVAGKEPPRFPAGTGAENAGRGKVPAAWLIEHAGFGKGYSLGPAAISSRHTLALINKGEATAKDILALAERIRLGVESMFGVRLEIEPVLVGF